MDAWNLLLEVVVLLSGCLALGAICSRLKQSPIIGYLVAGMFLGGPGSLRLVHSERDIEALAELGVTLLLFGLGLEFSWKRLLGLGVKTLLSGVAQVLVTSLTGIAVAFALGGRGTEAITLGAIVSLSSTAVVMRVLIDRGDIDSVHARNSLAILLVQDLAVVPLAMMVTLLKSGGEISDVLLVSGKIMSIGLILVVSLYVLLNRLAVPVLRRLTYEQNRELAVVLAIVLGLGSAWMSHAVQLSPSLGAFVAGMFLGGSPFAVQLRADVSSLRILLLTLFFGAVGLVANPIWIMAHLPTVLGLALLMLVAKFVVAFIVVKAFGQATSCAVATAMCLAQVGEFAFALASSAHSDQLISDEGHMLLVSATVVTLFVTPYLVMYAPRVGNWIEHRSAQPRLVNAPSTDRAGFDVVIIGFGPAGQAVAQSLKQQPYRVLVVDLNPQGTMLAQSWGFDAYIGDGTQFEVLEHIPIDRVKYAVITLPSLSAAMTSLMAIKQLAPHVHVIVRSRYQRHLKEFEQCGADAVIGDEEQVGYRLSAYLLICLDLPE